MAIQMYQEQSPYEDNVLEEAQKQTKRSRWATHRAPGQQGQAKRRSILNRLHKRTSSGMTASTDPKMQDQSEADEEGGEGRTIYFNMPLPDQAKDEEGNPLVTYTRNKVRTAKYTALSFIPKDLWFQFHNIANIYFLFIIILSVCFGL